MLLTLFYFILALILLILVHEYGHFLVARLCGVKVLRFSFGFGKLLASFKDRQGTEYSWSLLPLGGYIKMLDENEGPVAAEERHSAFNTKSVWQRMAIIAAGPIFNLLFAYLAIWLSLVIGIKTLAPVIEAVKPGSIAAKAGLSAGQEIVAINAKPIASWRDLHLFIIPYLAASESLPLELLVTKAGKQERHTLLVPASALDANNPDLVESLGIEPYLPAFPSTVGEVLPKGAAAKAGIQVQDKILRIDGHVIRIWRDLTDYVKPRPNQRMQIELERAGKTLSLSLVSGMMEEQGQAQGFLGLRSVKLDLPENWLRTQREGPLSAFKTAFEQTSNMTLSSFLMIGRLVSGKLSLKNMSGPVGIAQGAGDSGRSGIAYYLSFLAIVSISLGVLNLLPIPILDGGHLLYCVLELVLRRPVSLYLRNLGSYLGLIFLVALMILAMANDLTRLIAS